MLYILLIIFILLNIADTYFTIKGLEKGLTEMNPFLKWIIGKFGNKGLIGSKVIIVGLITVLSCLFQSTVLTGILSILCVLYVYVVYRNYTLLEVK